MEPIYLVCECKTQRIIMLSYPDFNSYIELMVKITSVFPFKYICRGNELFIAKRLFLTDGRSGGRCTVTV